jgi:uncharacterized membrane protein
MTADRRPADGPGLTLGAALLTNGLMAGLFPLNDDLAAAGDPARIADVAAVRDHFEDPWVAWNIVRGVASTAALACLGWALVLYGRARATTR